MRTFLSFLALSLSLFVFSGAVLAQDAQQETGDNRLYLGVFHDIQIGPGLATFKGSMDGNPEDNAIHFASRANPSFFIQGVRNLGSGLSVGADLSYERIYGLRSRDRIDGVIRPLQFSNNLLSADILAFYELGFIPNGYFKVFAGGGPTLLIAPRYNFDELTNAETPDGFGELRRDLGTRPVMNTTVGVLILNQLRIGYRMPLTSYVDGWEGFPGEDRVLPYDLILYIQFGFTLEQINDALGAVFRL